MDEPGEALLAHDHLPDAEAQISVLNPSVALNAHRLAAASVLHQGVVA
jgi:hypothetical protein